MTAPAQETPKTFRPEIEGLRAVAAILVAVFHVYLGRVSGGVDVFFVVSGFLITTTLVNSVLRRGRLGVAAYGARLVKRLLPAALFVLAGVIVASVLWLPRSRWPQTAVEVAASALYVENWQLAFASVDYLQRDNSSSPVQHFWAISVQGQFYVLWPILIALVVAAGALYRRRYRRALFAAFALVFAASLCYSIVATAVNQPFTYFNTFARGWEFALGGMLALALPLISLPRAARWALGWIGLAGVATCGMLLQVSSVFPGYAALWPTVAAVLVLLGGDGGFKLSAGRLLGSPPLRYLGSISYSLYLWHWPVLMFYLIVAEHDAATWRGGIYVLAASLALAAATQRLVERPIRFSALGKLRPSRAYAFGAALLVPVLAVSIGGHAALTAENEQAAKETAQVDVADPDYPGAAAMVDGFEYAGAADVPIKPDPSADRDISKLYDDGCHQTIEDPEPIKCVYGSDSPEKVVALVGGSHSAQWFPALELLAEEHDWALVSYTKSACIFTTNAQNLSMTDPPSCAKWNDAMVDELLELKPDLIFTLATRGHGEEEEVPEGYLEQFQRMTDAGIDVLAVRDNPWSEFDVKECVEMKLPDVESCGQSRADALKETSPTEAHEGTAPNLSFLDMSDYFCDESRCPPIIGNILVYYDRHHISATYMRSLAPMAEPAVLDALEA
ncbi:MAG: acyltransferase family protein [Stackebrandtia sp.]